MKKFFLLMSLLCVVGLIFVYRSDVNLDAKWFFGIIYAFDAIVFSYVFLVQIGVEDFRIKLHHITFKGHYTKKRYWFPDGILIGILLFLNEPFWGMKSRWTFSRYDTYEAIESHGGFFLWPWKLYYKKIGYSEKKENLSISAFNPDNVTYWQPWMNVN